MLRSVMFGLMIVSLVAGCESGNGKGTAGNNSSSAMTAAASGDSMTAAKPITPEQRRADPVYGYVDSVRKDLSDGKVQLINQVMRLSPEESAKFWPIYHDYEEELFALGDQRVEMSKKFAQSYATRSLDDASAAALANDWFKFENQRLDLLHKYYDRIAGDLSATRAAEFVQIENRVGNVVDLMIASETPLIGGARASAAAGAAR